MKFFTTALLLLTLGLPSLTVATDSQDDPLGEQFKEMFPQMLALAKELEEAEDQFYVGFMYEYGEGTAQNYEEAAKWYQRSAEQGYASAQLHLGLLYQLGNGVAQDHKKAVMLYQHAADQGLPLAQFQLACAYHIGIGVTKDITKAIELYTLAAEHHLADAQFNLGGIYMLGEDVPQDYSKAYMWFTIADMNGSSTDDNGQNPLKYLIRNAPIKEKVDGRLALNKWLKAHPRPVSDDGNSKTAEPADPETDDAVIYIAEDGTFSIEGKTTDIEKIVEKLSELGVKNTDLVRIKAVPSAPTTSFIELTDVLKAAGYKPKKIVLSFADS